MINTRTTESHIQDCGSRNSCYNLVSFTSMSVFFPPSPRNRVYNLRGERLERRSRYHLLILLFAVGQEKKWGTHRDERRVNFQVYFDGKKTKYSHAKVFVPLV